MAPVDGLTLDTLLAANADCEPISCLTPQWETPSARMERLTGRVAAPENAPEDPLFAGMRR